MTTRTKKYMLNKKAQRYLKNNGIIMMPAYGQSNALAWSNKHLKISTGKELEALKLYSPKH